MHNNTKDDTLGGFTLRKIVTVPSIIINRIAWSPDGHTLAIPSYEGMIFLWDMQGEVSLLGKISQDNNWIRSVAWSPDGKMLISSSDSGVMHLWDIKSKHATEIKCTDDWIRSVAWSPDGTMFACGANDYKIQVWDARTKRRLQTLDGHEGVVNYIAWSPNGHFIASGSNDKTLRFWDMKTGLCTEVLRGHADEIFSTIWSSNGQIVISGSKDRTIRVWEANQGRETRVLEGHTNAIIGLSISCDERLLASKSADGTIRIWRTDTWETVKILEEPSTISWFSSPAFHPTDYTLATVGEMGKGVYIWDLDISALLEIFTSSIYYVNAKTVLVGDSGVGKSGLSLVLTGQAFVPTESTHSRNVWSFDSQEVTLNRGYREIREILLWDLAGQPGYRLTHQLYLNEVTVALVVFDSHSETDPFAGVHHWVRALRSVQHIQGSSVLPMKMFLVAARLDRGGRRVSQTRIDSLVRELHFDRYFETSAKEGLNIAALAEAIKQVVDWAMLPKVTSTELFQRIKTFLVTEKESGRRLSTFDDLYLAFQKSEKSTSEIKDLYKQFETCIGRAEAQGLIRKLSFGNFLLLQPELLDIYASSLINAVKGEPDGLGSMLEERIKVCDFLIPTDKRLLNRDLEKLLLIAMVEDLLRYEIALREPSEEGAYLIFPSQSTRENPDLPYPERKSVVFTFEGPVMNIYATLAVRLSHSGLFVKEALWKDAITYTTKVGGIYGMFLNNMGEGRAELSLFFDEVTGEETRFYFEEYVKTHLQRRAQPGTIQRQRIFVCPQCLLPVDNLYVTERRKRGYNSIICGVCEIRISLADDEEHRAESHGSLVSKMDSAANVQREREVATSILQGRSEIGDFDVFLCHNHKDKPKVKEIGKQLKERNILPWLDEWELRPGLSWQRLLEKQISNIKSTAVFVGKDGLGPWQQEEVEAFLREFVCRGCPVIPVLLPDAPAEPKLPIFLKGITWVDFRKDDPDPMTQLIWGITGKHRSIE